ncbi:MAG: hypothetical protein LBP63_07880 [Prevotellaceae bacterium]|jgi:hypothetical protein|nr:hypothetical protein [Prevotellaceae bacterium]
MMTLANIIRDSAYCLTQFSDEQIQNIEKNIIVRNAKDKETYEAVRILKI